MLNPQLEQFVLPNTIRQVGGMLEPGAYVEMETIGFDRLLWAQENGVLSKAMQLWVQGIPFVVGYRCRKCGSAFFGSSMAQFFHRPCFSTVPIFTGEGDLCEEL